MIPDISHCIKIWCACVGQPQDCGGASKTYRIFERSSVYVAGISINYFDLNFARGIAPASNANPVRSPIISSGQRVGPENSPEGGSAGRQEKCHQNVFLASHPGLEGSNKMSPKARKSSWRWTLLLHPLVQSQAGHLYFDKKLRVAPELPGRFSVQRDALSARHREQRPAAAHQSTKKHGGCHGGQSALGLGAGTEFAIYI